MPPSHPALESNGNQEVEFKFRVQGDDELQALGRAAGGMPCSVVLQENHFFDSDSLCLRAHGMVLRVREEEGSFHVTAKGGGRPVADQALSHRREEELPIGSHLAHAVLRGELSPLKILEGSPRFARSLLLMRMNLVLAGRPLVRVGSFRNRRTHWPARLLVTGVPVDVVLELDQTVFPGEVVQHEMEVEVPPGVEPGALGAALRELMERAGVHGQTAPGKSTRFFAALSGHSI